jgi:enoyl-CoA hydratase/carnithine racemase
MEQVRVERDGRVMTVTLDNPPRNFMTSQMVRELDEVVSALRGDNSIGSVVITGAPDDTFITHFDVREILAGSDAAGQVPASVAGGALRAVGALSHVPGAKAGLERTPVAGMVELRRIHELFLRMNRMDKIFIAAINGFATGGGCELALACDIRLMAKGDGRIGQPEILVGIIPGAGGTQRLTRILGPGPALESMLEGTIYTPEEAEALGIVTHVVPADELLPRARDIAARLARRSPTAVEGLKRAVYEGASSSLRDGLHIERAEFLASASTPGARRAMEAYVQDVEELGGAPLAHEDLATAWRDGTRVDVVSD